MNAPTSPHSPSVAWIDGRLVDFAEAAVPLEDRGLQFGESLYEVVPIVGGALRLFDLHLARIRGAARWLELDDGLPDEAGWRELFAALQAREGIDEGILYAQLSGGVAPRAHHPAARPRPRLWAYLRALRYPRADACARGIRAITVDDLRWARADLKTTMLLPAVLGRRAAARRGANEALFVGADGELREGAASNLFIVEGRRIVTPRLSEHLLPGVTRGLVERVAAPLGIEVVSEAIDRPRLLGADEVFITSTTQLVMPVVAIDDAPIGGGESGPIARALAAGLRRELGLDEGC